MVLFDNIPKDIHPLILSLLPIKEAIKTSILSQSWKHSWKDSQAYTRNMIFNYATLVGGVAYTSNEFDRRLEEEFQISNKVDEFDRKEAEYQISNNFIENFIKCIDIVLEHHQGIGQSFKVELPLRINHAYNLDKWVSFAIRSSIRVLCLTLGNVKKAGWTVDKKYPGLYRFPCELFLDEGKCHLECLQLDFVSFKLQRELNGFKSLRKFELQESDVTDEDMTKFSSSCVLLECLSIKHCRNLVYLLIPASFCQLKFLCVEGCQLRSLKLQATELTTLEYKGEVIDFVLSGSPCLSNASLRFNCWGGMIYFATRLSSDFPHVQTLYLDIFQALTHLNIPSGHSGFNYLKSLVLFIDVLADEDWEFHRISRIVNCAPLLEQLELHMEHSCCSCSEDSSRMLLIEASEPSMIPRLPHNNLKKIELTGFTGSEGQIELARYFLTTTNALEVMIINPKERKSNRPFSPAVLSERRCKAYKDLPQDVPAHAKFIVL